MVIKPSFYDAFRCKADKCEDSCCIGWEIDVDDDSLAYYGNISGEFGEKLRKSIETDGEFSFFRLCEGDRCPFLENGGLCEIYKNLGEDALCDICREHPRFYNQTDDITEMGLGLCCEKVCEQLFDGEYNLGFVSDEKHDELSYLHRNIIDIVNNNTDIISKMNMLLGLFSGEACSITYNSEMRNRILLGFSETEPINDEWVSYIQELSASSGELTTENIDMNSSDYSKLLLYTLFRHLPKSECDDDFLYWTLFACVSTMFVIICDSFTYCKKGGFTFSDRIENVKRWSKQTEYSTENIEIIMSNF